MTSHTTSTRFYSTHNYLSLSILIMLSLLVQLLPSSELGFAARQFSTSQVNPNSTAKTTQSSPAKTAAITEHYGQLPLSFELNQGQVDNQVKFFSRGSGYSFFLTGNEMVFSLQKSLPKEEAKTKFTDPSRRDLLQDKPQDLPPPTVVRMSLLGGNSDPQMEGLEELPGKSNYFIGNDPAHWHTNVSTYSKVQYKSVYPGIDLVFYGNQRQLEYDFVAQPGANLEAIKLGFQGATGLETNEMGQLVIHTPDGDLVQHAPVIYQEIGGSRKPVAGRYRIEPGQSLVGFDLDEYDRNKPLVIDPILVYSTYLSGSGGEAGNSITVDGNGNAYVIGETYSTNFPTKNPLQSNSRGGIDVFVTKLNSSGSALLYSTYLGGSSDDLAKSIAVDSNSNIYITGYTYSANFPTQNAFQSVFGGGTYDAFVAKLNLTGSSLVYSTYLGGNNFDAGYGITVDSNGNAYVTGYTQSVNFPTQSPFQATKSSAADDDAFIAKLNSNGTALLYSTYFGGNYGDYGYSIAVDGSGNAYVTGFTYSTNFPIQNPFQAIGGGGNAYAFIMKLSSNGSALLYSTYLGGSSGALGQSIVVDGNGNAYVTGYTYSTNFPTQNAFQSVFGGGAVDVFVAKLSPNGNTLLYSTYLGGTSNDYGYGIAVDGNGNAYVTGVTQSTNFPIKNPFQAAYNGSHDAFVAKLSPNGNTLLYSTYLGGSAEDDGYGIAVDGNGNTFVTGRTNSTNFPTQNPFQAANNNGVFAAFINKLWLYTPPSAPPAPEMAGGGSPSQPNTRATQGCSCDPVNTASGNFWHTFNDFSIPGRGIPLAFSHTYNSQFAGVDGPLGFGWTFNYNLALTQDGITGNVTIQEEGGSQLSFAKSGSNYTPPSRTIAALVKNGDGTFTFTRRAREIFTFSAAGKLLKIQDLNGYITTLSYDGSGHLTFVIDPAGRKLTLAYTGNHLTRVTDPDPSGNRFINFSYDGQGNLASVTNLDSFATTFTYDVSHRLLTMTDPGPGAGTITNHYDAQGRVDWQTDQLGRKTSLAYQTGSTLITDPKGNSIFEQYINGTRVATTKGYGTPQAATWLYTYDLATLGITSITDPDGHTTNYTYDASGNLLSSTDPLGRTTTNTYNLLNLLTSTTDPKGITTTFNYDPSGNLLSRSRPLNGSQNQVTSFAYADGAHPGDVTAMTDPNTKTWTYTYDTYGNQTSATDPLGNKTTFTYNLLGWKLSQVSPRGNAPGGNPAQYTTTITQDSFGRVASITDPLVHLTSFSYDPRGNLTQTTDGRGKVTKYTYDVANQRTFVIRADLTTLKTDYYPDGTIWKEYDGKNNITTYTYDPLRRLASVSDPLGRTTTYTYDGAGNRLTMTDAMQPPRTTTFSYDAANWLKTIIYSDGVTPNVTNIQYDALGQRIGMTDGTGTSSWTYDQLSRLVSYTSGAGAMFSYGYDLKGQLTSLTYPGNQIVNRGYDNAGRWVNVTDWLTNTTAFGYDADSNLSQITYPGGSNTNDVFTFNPANQITSINYSSNNTIFASLTYGRDANGQVASVTPVGLVEPNKTYSYNALNQLTGVNGSSSYYSYDAADNLTGFSGSSQAYDAANQLTNQTRGGSNTTFSYDRQGNRTAITPAGSSAITYSYDQANRLVGYGSQATYRYNGDGLRMSKMVKGVNQPFGWNIAGGLPLLIRDDTTSYVYGPGGLPLEQISATNQVLYYHHDQLGSTRFLTDSTGAVKASYSYDEWGNPRVKTGAVSFSATSAGVGVFNSGQRLSAQSDGVSNPFGYAGQYTDSETGLIYLRARYYDPGTAQFISRDPLVASTKQAYLYANANPLNYVDVNGMNFELSDLFGLKDLREAGQDTISKEENYYDALANSDFRSPESTRQVDNAAKDYQNAYEKLYYTSASTGVTKSYGFVGAFFDNFETSSVGEWVLKKVTEKIWEHNVDQLFSAGNLRKINTPRSQSMYGERDSCI